MDDGGKCRTKAREQSEKGGGKQPKVHTVFKFSETKGGLAGDDREGSTYQENESE